MKKKKLLVLVLFYIFIIVLCVLWLFPLLFIVLTAFKTPAEFFSRSMLSLPETLRVDNFVKAWKDADLGQYIKNGAIVSFFKVPLGILIESLAAFAMTRLGLRHKNGIFMFFLLGMMIPMQVALVGLNVAFTRTGLTNTYFGLFYVYIGFGIPFGILVLRGFFRTIPAEIDEAARIDGCGNLKLYGNIMLPIIKPAVATLFILDFLSTWNEFLLASVLITDNKKRTVAAGLLGFFGEFNTDYSLLCAGVLISIIPVLVVYIFFQRYFVEGLAGAVKG